MFHNTILPDRTGGRTFFFLAGLLFAAGLLLATPLHAASFTVNAAPPADTVAKTLGSGSGQTGTVVAGGILAVSGSTVAVTITGNNATLTNLGTIDQTGTGRVIRDNTGVTGLVINNGSTTNSTALMQAADADVIQMNKSPASVTLNNFGTLLSLNASAGGSQAVDFNAITSGANIVNNYAGGLLKAVEADAVRPGVNGVVYNAGTILSVTTTGSSSDGVDAQTNSGIQITNDTTGLIEGGRHGITGGDTTGGVYTMGITNHAGGVIKGDNGSGINIDGLNANETVTIVNHGIITGHGVNGDGDGVDVDGVVNLTNTGTIQSLNSHNDVSEGVTVGGGTITNSGTIRGSIDPLDLGNTGTGRGITIAGVDKDSSDHAIPIQAPYAATTITNQAGGLIRGDSDSGIAFTSALASGFSHHVDNQVGATIQGGGATAPAILTAADAVTIDNAGTIDGSSSGKAITGGAGNLTVNILGGNAVVNGAMTGGTGTDSLKFDLGAATNTFTQNGAITNFEHVEIASGDVQLSGALSLGADTNTLAVQSGGILDLRNGSLTVNQGLVVVDGALKYLLTSDSTYGQLFFGPGDLGGLTFTSTSVLDLDFGYAPLVGTQFTLVDFLGGSPFLSGTFAGLGEGASFMQDGYQFQISYQGNEGHDIVITRTVPDASATLGLLAVGLGLLALARRFASPKLIHA